MKSILISTLVLLGLSTVMCDFNPDYILKIFEVARSERIVINDDLNEGSSRATLSCPPPSPGISTSVHALKPQDIQIIGAIGDSLTAANGAKARTSAGLIFEDRGVSWSIGCESSLDKTLTFASILKHLNSNLYGCSTGTGKQNDTSANLNLADPGDTSFEMLGQAKLLVSRLRSSVADADNKWKLINFFIGGNDLCEACKRDRQKPENFLKNVRETLDYFEANLPRTVVNLVLTLDVTGIEVLPGPTFTCRTLQKSFCACALDPNFRTQIKILTDAYQKDVADLINSGQYDNNPLFTVVLHSFMTKMTPPFTDGQPDYSYFAPDCFHFSVKGHETTAVELWNSMLTPHNSRNDKWTIGQAIKCPSLTSPYIYTKKTPTSLKTLLSN